MSLIHEALKKAQPVLADKPATPELMQFSQENTEGKEKPKANIRTIVLAGVLVCAMGYVVYQKFYGGKPKMPVAPSANSGGAAGGAQSAQNKELEAMRLKEEASKAYQANNLEVAWVRLQTAGQTNPTDHEIWNNLGLIAKRRGDINKAREFYNRAIQLKPDYAECLNNMGVLDMDEGNLKEAAERLRKATVIRPDYTEALFNLALIAEQQGEITLAMGYYKKFLETAKDVSPELIDHVNRHVADIEPSK